MTLKYVSSPHLPSPLESLLLWKQPLSFTDQPLWRLGHSQSGQQTEPQLSLLSPPNSASRSLDLL